MALMLPADIHLEFVLTEAFVRTQLLSVSGGRLIDLGLFQVANIDETTQKLIHT